MYSHLEPVVLMSDGSWNDPIFSGYAFVGSHLIVGRHGYAEWLSGGRRQLGTHEDGCYIVVRSDADGGAEIGSDYKGYCKIYYYRDGARWGVSNSFSKLIDVARARGWKVTPNASTLSTWSFPGPFWQQLSSFSTAVEEISLLPRQDVLKVSANGDLRLVERVPEQIEPNRTEYEHLLGRFVQTWIGRLGTFFRDERLRLTLELTGGMDSRVGLSLLLGLRQFFPTNFGHQLTVRSSTAYPVDLDIAKDISSIYRLRFNQKVRANGLGVFYTPQYDRWREFVLGSYGLVYWPARSSANGVFALGGHGGEGHRSYWRYESPHSVLKSVREHFPSPHVHDQAHETFNQTAEVLRRSYPGIPPTVAHYREFRDRLHSGLHALHGIRLQPLASSLLYRAAAHLTPEELDRGQMLYDIVGLVAPALMAIRYDDDAKIPSQKILENLCVPRELRPMRGQVFGLGDQQEAVPSAEQPWVRVAQQIDAVSAGISPEHVPTEVIEQARVTVSALAAGERLKHPRETRPVHHVMLAGLANGSV